MSPKRKNRIVIDARQSGTSTGRYVDKLIENIDKTKSGYEIIVLTTQKRINYLRAVAPGCKVITTPYKNFSFGEQVGLWKQIHKLKADLVHFLMVQQPVLYMGKTITTMHDLTAARFVNPTGNRIVFLLKQLIYKVVNRLVARKSIVVLTPSEYVKDDVAKYTKTNSRKYVVTYESADKIKEKSNPVDSLENRQFIVCVGRSQAHKNLEGLIEAFVHIRQHKPELYLVLAGKKDVLYKRLEKTIRSKAIKNIIFTDFVTDGQLRWLYEHAEAYVFPSLSEGFGLPGLEAMVHGCPVVSSNATCLPEVYGDAAHYFDPENTEDMATKILEVISDKNLSKSLVKKGYKQAAKYSWKKTAEQTLEVYKRVLEKE